jgi:hypothetical protein
MSYLSEQALVDQFTEVLERTSEHWGGIVDFALEFFYQRGRTDVVALSGEGDVIAFEAKLLRWREALHQAYRNTCFAHLSYVLLPADVAYRAAQWEREFARRGIGVCTLEDGALKILVPARKGEPVQRWLSKKAAEHISGAAGEC